MHKNYRQISLPANCILLHPDYCGDSVGVFYFIGLEEGIHMLILCYDLVCYFLDHFQPYLETF